MAKFEIFFKPSAEKELLKLPNPVVAELLATIYQLADNPYPDGAKKLKGRKPPCFRVRVGNYRIIYEIKNQQLLVHILAVGHRKDIYH
ncbi:MAG: type II toxin-antitoxin system RelE/ParE family toxin [Methylovulum miyakonense]|uniref:type II toxin-antitoxin system RelE family toxin n=1 Tax=Methylovulum miyakonense TaxID=645578 RepID=UPI003BB6B569